MASVRVAALLVGASLCHAQPALSEPAHSEQAHPEPAPPEQALPPIQRVAANAPWPAHREPPPSAAVPAPAPENTQPDPFHDYPPLPEVYVPPEDPSYLDRSLRYLLESRETVSSAVEVMGRKMDNYFSGDQYQADHNDSYIRLRVGETWAEAGRLEPEFDYKFRLDLPGTKKRYRLVLAYGDDNETSLEDRTRPSEAARPQEDPSLFAGLLRTLTDESGRWETKLGAGVKVKLPPDPFVRAAGRRRFELENTQWDLELKSSADWFHSDGWHGEFDVIWQRLLREDALFRASTLFDWREEKDTLEFGQTFGVYQDLGPKDAIVYEIGAFGTSYAHTKVNTYYISADYRRDLYKDWLYMNVIPELAFPREEDFSGVASITVTFEIFFR